MPVHEASEKEQKEVEMNTISTFSGKYRFLSNFWPLVQPIRDKYGIEYPTVEHAYQAMKTLDRAMREKIAQAMSPGQAKMLGRRVRLREDWDEVKLTLMYLLNSAKFSHEPLRSMLKETGDATLIEGNTWRDTYWGVCNGVGENNLGKILMKIRSRLVLGCDRSGL